MRHMPLFFDMHNRRILVIGGGKVALRKSVQLSSAGAAIKVVAPEIIDEFNNMIRAELVCRPARPDDVSNEFSFVIIASSCKETNDAIAQRCLDKQIFFSRCDSFEAGDFITGNTLVRGEIICSVVSGGVPEISRQLKESFNELITPELEKLAMLLSELRPAIKASQKLDCSISDFIKRWASPEILKRLESEGIEAVRQEILACL